MKRSLAAFSLLELLLAIALMSMLVSLPLAVNATIPQRIQADGAQTQVAHSLRLAQQYAMVGREDSSWGVYIQNRAITVFKGNSYVSRDTAFDDTYTYDPKISISITGGAPEIVFAKLSGVPSSNVAVSITGVGNAKLVTFTIDGALSFN